MGSEKLTGWQPIETAPKDGTMFLIYVPTAKSRIISTSRGGQFWCQEDWAKRGGYTVCDDHGRPVKATHWQPFPAPPGTTRAPADLRSALEAGSFLLERLADHENRISSEEDAREWHGHVAPAMARFRAALAPTKGDAS